MTFGIERTTEEYSYIKSPSKGVCTVTQVTWLNDLYNHPEYKQIISSYESFQKWKFVETKIQEREINMELKLFKSRNVFGKTLININEKLKEIDEKKIPSETRNQSKNSSTYYYPRAEFTTLKTKIEKIIKQTNINLDTLIEIKNMYTIIKEYVSKYLYSIPNTEKLFKSIEKMEIKTIIINNYLISDNIPLNDNSEDKNKKKQVIATFWGKGYNKYNGFMDTIKKFTNRNIFSSNYLLQDTIDDYINGNNENNNFGEIMYPYNSKFSENIKKLINTGITIKRNEEIKYNIYVRMDVIQGEINDENVNKIDCAFNDKYLGNELINLLKINKNTWELEPMRFFFDSKTLKTTEINNDIFQINNIPQKNYSQDSFNRTMRGGRTKYKNRKSKKNRE
jgi:hypothetical protein